LQSIRKVNSRKEFIMVSTDLQKMELLVGSVPLSLYQEKIKETDQFSENDLIFVLLGLYGEVGSIMSAAKKYKREPSEHISLRDAIEEEFGDALWYFTAVCRRVDCDLSDVFEKALDDNDKTEICANESAVAPISQSITPKEKGELNELLIDLGQVAAELLKLKQDCVNDLGLLVHFAGVYVRCINSVGLSFAKVVRKNINKTLGRFIDPKLSDLPDFDKDFVEEEQLPRNFEITITQRKSGESYLMWNGVFLGSPLTDNIADSDGYRFHDVFHLAYAAILHWSPTFRALIKHKRKSNKDVDEGQDSGRAIVVEEGLTAWLYSYSKGHDYFNGKENLPFDVLKTIKKFVSGYEVEECPLKLWEKAILDGYKVFRQVKENEGGVIIGDRFKRTLEYKAIGKLK